MDLNRMLGNQKEFFPKPPGTASGISMRDYAAIHIAQGLASNPNVVVPDKKKNDGVSVTSMPFWVMATQIANELVDILDKSR